MTSFTLTLFDEGATKSVDVIPREPNTDTLDGFPLLVRGPQWGEGVRTEDNGTPVTVIAQAVRAMPDHAILAKFFDTTEEHIRQALAYAAAVAPKGPA